MFEEVEEVERKHPLAMCEVCPLYSKGKYCDGEGPMDAEIMILGEAPGFKEAQEGRPFTGPSGQLLDGVLRHHNIDRDSIYVTNAVLCRPPGNETPNATAVAACAPRLEADIDLLNPHTIVALGAIAAQAITGDKNLKITQARVGPPKDIKGRRFIPSIHPAAALRVPDYFPNIVKDIGKIKNPEMAEFSPPKYKVFDKSSEAVKVLDELLRKKEHEAISVDIEAGVDKDSSFTHPNKLLCVGVGYARDKAIVIGGQALKHKKVQQKLSEVLQQKKIICHNGKYDLQVLHHLGYLDSVRGRLHFDTMLSSYCMDERPGIHGLKYRAKEELGAPDWDSEIKAYLPNKDASFELIPTEVLYKYNAYDVVCTYALYELDQCMLELEGFRELHDFLCEASMELLLVESQGLRVDLEYLDNLSEEFQKSLLHLESKMQQLLERPSFNPRSPKQISEILLEDFGIKTPSTDAEHLAKLYDTSLRKGLPELTEFLELLLKQRKEQKYFGTYVKGIKKRSTAGKVFPTLLLHGTTTGRLACRNPNLQNIPRESAMRKMFVADDGHLLCHGDYKQAELRVMATEAEDTYLQAVFNEGRDIHSEVATTFYGEDFDKEQRVRAKAIVFGLAYGREAYSISQAHNMPLQEAQQFIDTFFSMIPDVVAWKEQTKYELLAGSQQLWTRFGRCRRFPLITKDNKLDVLKEAYAFIPQSTASDITLRALMALTREGLPVCMTVHDSIIAQVRADEAEDVVKRMTEVMETVARNEYTDFVRFEADASYARSWGEIE